MVYNFFDKKWKGGGVNIDTDNDNLELHEEIHKLLIRTL